VFKLDAAGTETVLHSFTGGADGGDTTAGLISDPDGNLYGTAPISGFSHGAGVVFKLDDAGTENLLQTFAQGPDGCQPLAGLLRDAAGNLFGTASVGGGPNAACQAGCGVVFKIAP
jgi:uncharacterized repeat protein (TIGR03803 family)